MLRGFVFKTQLSELDFLYFLFLSFITNTTDYLLILFFSFLSVVDYVNCTVLVSPLASQSRDLPFRVVVPARKCTLSS